MEKFDAVIVGAGTAGLSAGIALKRSRKNYVILDRKGEIGLPVRSTGAVSLMWVDRIGMPRDPKIVSSEISGISFRTDTGKDVSLQYDRPVGLVYDFTKYEKFLADEMEGALNYRLKTSVNFVEGSVVHTSDGDIEADHIIYAAGPQSAFGRKLGKSEALVAYEETRELPPRKDFQMVLWFSDLVPGGYVWDFAESPTTRKVGVCYYPLKASQPKAVLDEFTRRFPEVDGKMQHTMAHQIPLTEPAATVVNGKSYYTGDMVNAVLNTTAGGLQGAFWSGYSAGIAAAKNDPSYYQKKWDEEIRPWLMKHHRLHGRMHRKGVRSVEKLMTLSKLMPMSIKKRVFGGL